MKCPHCKKEIDLFKKKGAKGGKKKSEAKAEAARINGAKSKGRPPTTPTLHPSLSAVEEI